jgi:cholesterol transport system auxiliary component
VSKLRVLTLTAALTASLALGGCISLLPKTKPAQLYRFGENVGMADKPAAAPALNGGPVTGLTMSTGFTRAADGDRILTATGAQSAYIAESRWVSPASVLFDEAAARAFENAGAPFRLLRRGDIGSTTLALRIDVETFEADYPADGKGAPTVVVRARVLLMRPGGRGDTQAHEFVSRQPAAENRVGAIVAAFDSATGDLLDQVVTWTTASAPVVSSSG